MDVKILIVEDDADLAATFQRFLRGAGYLAEVVGDYAGGKARLTAGGYHAVFMDINLQGPQTGLDLLKELRAIDNTTPVVIITGYPEVATAAEAVRHTAFDYLCKPVEKEQLLQIAAAAVTDKNRRDEKERYLHSLETAFQSVRATVATAELRATASPLPVADDRQRPMPQEATLSERERQILTLLGQGESNADIAALFSISIRTVETYFSRIIEKLELPGMKGLRRYALKSKTR